MVEGFQLKNYAEQLADIFCFMFSASLQQQKVPCLWKDSTIIPVPKSKAPKIDVYKPVTLTSLIMKTWIVKYDRLCMVHGILEPFQFAYRSGRGVDDATSTLLHMILSQL